MRAQTFIVSLIKINSGRGFELTTELPNISSRVFYHKAIEPLQYLAWSCNLNKMIWPQNLSSEYIWLNWAYPYHRINLFYQNYFFSFNWRCIMLSSHLPKKGGDSNQQPCKLPFVLIISFDFPWVSSVVVYHRSVMAL